MQLPAVEVTRSSSSCSAWGAEQGIAGRGSSDRERPAVGGTRHTHTSARGAARCRAAGRAGAGRQAAALMPPSCRWRAPCGRRRAGSRRSGTAGPWRCLRRCAGGWVGQQGHDRWVGAGWAGSLGRHLRTGSPPAQPWLTSARARPGGRAEHPAPGLKHPLGPMKQAMRAPLAARMQLCTAGGAHAAVHPRTRPGRRVEHPDQGLHKGEGAVADGVLQQRRDGGLEGPAVLGHRLVREAGREPEQGGIGGWEGRG